MHRDLDQRARLARLLRELPDDALPPPYDFREFQRRAAQRTLAAPARHGGRLFAAAAAIAVTALAVLLRFGAPAPHVAVGLVPIGELAPPQAPTLAPARPEVLEHWLASLPSDPALVRVGARAAVSGLEDRIAQLDDQLSAVRLEPAQAGRLYALQQERTRLMGALVQVRYAETLADAAR
jgi:hypothetical protein